jgi:hypothetical protein
MRLAERRLAKRRRGGGVRLVYAPKLDLNTHSFADEVFGQISGEEVVGQRAAHVLRMDLKKGGKSLMLNTEGKMRKTWSLPSTC